MLTILHAADFHLDSPFRSLPPREAQARRADQRKTLEQLRDIALDRRVDLVLLAGDLFDSREVYPETLETLARVLGQLPCPVVIAPGNHDYYDTKSPYSQPIWPENVHIFSSEAVSSFAFPALDTVVYGCAFTSPYREDDPLSGFSAPKNGGISLGIYHADVAKQSRYAPIAPESLEKSGLDYVALGHVHAPSGLQGETVPWAYPGCPQGRGFDELDDRGIYLVQVPDQGKASLEFVPLAGPRYREREADLTGREPIGAIKETLADCENDYVRLTLTGEAETLELNVLRAQLEPLCRVLELRDETARPRNVWARRNEDTLTGHFLREMAARLEAAPTEERDLVEAALAYGLAALEGREEPR